MDKINCVDVLLNINERAAVSVHVLLIGLRVYDSSATKFARILLSIPIFLLLPDIIASTA